MDGHGWPWPVALDHQPMVEPEGVQIEHNSDPTELLYSCSASNMSENSETV